MPVAGKKTIGSAHALERSVLVRAPVPEVWSALVEEDRLRVWFFEDAMLEAKPGGSLAFGGIEGNIAAEILEVEPGRLLSLRFDAPWFGVVTFLLGPTPSGCRVTLTHEGFEGREDWIMRFGWGWEAHLKNLKAYSEGRPIK